MKRVALLTVLALCLVFAVVGCGDDATNDGPSGGIDTSADYSTQMQQWVEKWGPEIEAKSDALDAIEDPTSVSDSQLKDVEDFAKTFENAAKDFRGLKPSSDAKDAHNGFADALDGMSDAMGELHKMLKKGGDEEALMGVLMLFLGAAMEFEEASSALEQATGIGIGGIFGDDDDWDDDDWDDEDWDDIDWDDEDWDDED